MQSLKSLSLVLIFSIIFSIPLFAQTVGGTLRGQVVDSLGAIVIGANVVITDSNGTAKTVVSGRDGNYSVSGLKPGKYTVRVTAAKFSTYENTEIEIVANSTVELIISLTVGIEEQVVTVEDTGKVSTDPDNNASSTVLKGTDLDALPDDPDDLAAALQALAGPGAGPNGGQIYIDGFTGGQIPPKESIREIRINSNPFSSEYDRLGFGRIEILTRPGSDKLRGQGFFNFNNQTLNSRNPYATFRAPTQTEFFGGNVSGPIIKKKSSFFFDIDNRRVNNNTVINAITLDPSFNIVPYNNTILVPSRRLSFGPRIDYAINDRNTIVARYSYNRNTTDNQGLNEFTLPSRAYSSTGTEHNIQLTETAILAPTVVNETRFQFERNKRRSEADNRIPAINVSGAFNGGGAQLGLSENTQTNLELQNYTTWSIGKHSLKAGVRLRNVKIDNISESNFGGSFNFSGRGADLNSIAQYRGRVSGLAGDTYLPNQFTITAGNPAANVSQFDYGIFINDDWKLRPDFTLSLGLRYENQTNISSNRNFSPRLGFAWSPGAGGARQPKTVIRGGFGIFYERFGENFTLNAGRFDGVQQRQYLVTDPAILRSVVFSANGTVSNVPTAAQLATTSPLSSIVYNISDDANAPYTLQGLVSVERQLPYKLTLGVTFIQQRSIGTLRQRNINAPVCPPFSSLQQCQTAVRPNPLRGNNYQYETTGFSNSQRLVISLRTNLNPRFTLFGNYSLGNTKSDTDGGFPAYSYDLHNEYSRASFDVRHNVVLGGSFTLPWRVRLNPFIIASSGRPFNITTGLDNNNDNIYNDRPAFATDLNRQCNFGTTITPIVRNCAVQTKYGNFDLQPISGQTIIPRNYAVGPGYFAVNLNTSRTFGFGGSRNAVARQSGQGGAAGGGGIPGIGGGGRGGEGGGGGGGGRGGGGFGGGSDSRYNLTVSLNVQNLFNTTNRSTPTGNLSSPLFGISNTSSGFGGFFGGGGGSNAGNRRVELQMRFSF